MGKVTLELSESEMRSLAEVCAMALTVLGQAMPEGREPKADQWHSLLVEIIKAGRVVPSLARDLEFNPDCGYWFFRRGYVDSAFYSDVLDEYRDATFWEELVSRLAGRALCENLGEPAMEALSPEERSSRVAALEKALWNEVSRHGVERLHFLLPSEES